MVWNVAHVVRTPSKHSLNPQSITRLGGCHHHFTNPGQCSNWVQNSWELRVYPTDGFRVRITSFVSFLLSCTRGHPSWSDKLTIYSPPYTNTVVFIDNYHENYGGPGYNLATGAHSTTSYLYSGTSISVFGTEYNLATNTIRPVKPLSNTFCSAGAFFPNGKLDSGITCPQF